MLPCSQPGKGHAQACHRPGDARMPDSTITLHNPLSLNNGSLHGQALDLVAQGADLRVEVRSLVRGQGDGDDGARHTAGTAEGDLAGDVLWPR